MIGSGRNRDQTTMRGTNIALWCAASIACFALTVAAPLRAQQMQGEQDAPAEDNPEPAQPAAKPTPAKPKKPAPSTAGAGKHTVIVNNGHGNPLVILSVTPPGASEAATVVLLRDLPPNTKKSVALPGTACIFDVYGRFEDDSTIGYSKLNLCKDHSINIRD
jgi:hypothetical protein